MAGKRNVDQAGAKKASFWESVRILAALLTVVGISFTAGYNVGLKDGQDQCSDNCEPRPQPTGTPSPEPDRQRPPDRNDVLNGGAGPPIVQTSKCGEFSGGTLRLCPGGMSWGEDGVSVTLTGIDQQGTAEPRAMLRITGASGTGRPVGFASGETMVLHDASGDKQFRVVGIDTSPPSVVMRRLTN